MSRWFTQRTTLSDILQVNYSAILLLPRLGIKLGFGDRSVAEVCQQYGISSVFVITMLNCYTFDNYEPDLDSLDNEAMRLLVPYLVRSHTYYAEERIPHIERHLQHIASEAGSRYADVLIRFFQDYRADMATHFANEEEHIFPLIEKKLDGCTIDLSKVSAFAKSHDSMVDKLSDLMQIVFKYLPSEGMLEELNELLFSILQFSFDLKKHALIEDKIMIPFLTRKEAGKK